MNARPPRISLVTVNRDYGHYLGATMDSVLDQAYHDLEYIVIDGNSRDQSLQIIHARA